MMMKKSRSPPTHGNGGASLIWLDRHPPVSTQTVKGAFKHLPALDGLGAYGYPHHLQNKSIDNQQIYRNEV